MTLLYTVTFCSWSSGYRSLLSIHKWMFVTSSIAIRSQLLYTRQLCTDWPVTWSTRDNRVFFSLFFKTKISFLKNLFNDFLQKARKPITDYDQHLCQCVKVKHQQLDSSSESFCRSTLSEFCLWIILQVHSVWVLSLNHFAGPLCLSSVSESFCKSTLSEFCLWGDCLENHDWFTVQVIYTRSLTHMASQTMSRHTFVSHCGNCQPIPIYSYISRQFQRSNHCPSYQKDCAQPWSLKI